MMPAHFVKDQVEKKNLRQGKGGGFFCSGKREWQGADRAGAIKEKRGKCPEEQTSLSHQNFSSKINKIAFQKGDKKRGGGKQIRGKVWGKIIS